MSKARPVGAEPCRVWTNGWNTRLLRALNWKASPSRMPSGSSLKPGRRVFCSAMDSTNSEIDQLERRLRQRDIDDRERQRLRQTIRELDRRRDRLRDDLNDQERRVDRLTQDWRPGMPPR